MSKTSECSTLSLGIQQQYSDTKSKNDCFDELERLLLLRTLIRFLHLVTNHLFCFAAMQHQVSVEISLDADYTTVVGDNSDEVIEQLEAQLAFLLGVSVEKLQNMKITPGL